MGVRLSLECLDFGIFHECEAIIDFENAVSAPARASKYSALCLT